MGQVSVRDHEQSAHTGGARRFPQHPPGHWPDHAMALRRCNIFHGRNPSTTMVYRCPVCQHPQVDETHLANHLAFTALVRGGDHESWLDETVPDWESVGEAELATRLADHVEATEGPAERAGQQATDTGPGHQMDSVDRETEEAGPRPVPEDGKPPDDGVSLGEPTGAEMRTVRDVGVQTGRDVEMGPFDEAESHAEMGPLDEAEIEEVRARARKLTRRRRSNTTSDADASEADEEHGGE